METVRTLHSHRLNQHTIKKCQSSSRVLCWALSTQIQEITLQRLGFPMVSKDIAAHITSEEPKFQSVLLVQSI
jgi:hypothetical protein